jgi:hypothetical protein
METDTDNSQPNESTPQRKNRRGLSFRKLAVFVTATLVLIGVALFLLDRFFIPYLEDGNSLVSRAWKEDTWKIAQMSYQRWNSPNGCSILQSNGIPVPENKTRSRRILVAGDSFGAAFGLVNVNEVWWRALQRELIRRGYNDVEIIGISSGHLGSTAGQIEQIERWAPKYHPDAVLFGYVVDDSEELDGGNYIVPHLTRYDPDATERVIRRVARSVVPNIAEVYISRQDRQENSKLSGPDHGYDYDQRELELLKGKNIERYQKTLDRMSSLFKQWNLPCYVITLPCVAGFYPEFDLTRNSAEYVEHVHDYYKQRYDSIAPYFARANLPFINLIEPYIAMLKSEPQMKGANSVAVLCATPADGHPSNLVTHFYANEVADFLEKKNPSLLGKRSNVVKKFPLKINDWMPPNTNLFRISDGNYVFLMPAQPAGQLFMPVRQPHVQLNFEMPTELKTLRLRGPGLKQSTVWLTSEDPEDGYDRRILHKLDTKKGNDVSWTLPAGGWSEHVNTVKISAIVKGPDNRIIITF